MKHLKTFENFKSTFDNQTIMYINGDITLENYTLYIDGAISEAWGIDTLSKWVDNIKDFAITKLAEVAYSILSMIKKVKDSGVMKKLMNVFNIIAKKAKSFKDKYPVLCKVVGYLLLIILFTIIFTNSAHAANGQENQTAIKITGVDMDALNTMIGYLDFVGDDKSLSILVDAKDGKLDFASMEEYKSVVQKTLDSFNKGIQEKNLFRAANGGPDVKVTHYSDEQIKSFSNVGKQFYQLIERGFDTILKGDSSSYSGVMNSKVYSHIEVK